MLGGGHVVEESERYSENHCDTEEQCTDRTQCVSLPSAIHP